MTVADSSGSYAHGASLVPLLGETIEAFPLTVTGKVQKLRMREIAAEELLLKGDTSLQQM